MASNMKGQGGIKRLLLQHGEKIAISLVGLIALWLIYKSTALPHLEDKFQAAKLQEEISQASSAVRNAEWPDAASELAKEVHVAQPIGEKADTPVNNDWYKTSQGLDKPIIAPTVLRTDPVLRNALDVRGVGGSGLFAFIDEQIRKQQELTRRAEEDERLKKEADRLEKEKNNPTPTGAETAPGRRNQGGPEFGVPEVFDPDHPKRRQVMNMTQALGVPRQGGERIERAYWAIVVAKVPIREQLKLYQDAFEKAKLGFDPTRDFPQYKGYLVQRAEVLPGKPLDWKPVPVYIGERKYIAANQPISPNGVGQPVIDKVYNLANQSWAGMSPDVIDQRFSDYILTFPLPPLVGRDWGPEATHPDIPLLADTPPLEEEVSPLAPTTSEQQRAVDSPFGSSDPNQVFPGNPSPGAMRGGFPGGPGQGRFNPEMMRGPMGGRYGRGSEMEGGMGPERGLGREGGQRSYGGGMPMGGAARTSLPKGVDYLLLRFFDFTVEPGKKYKYRVTLVLADPNYAIPENLHALAPEVLDRRRQESQAAKAQKRTRLDIRRIETWSDPSPTVGIPLSGNVRLVDVKAPAAQKLNDEPTAKLLVESFDVDEKNNAIQAAKEKEFRRGSVANMTEDTEYLGDAWIDTKEGFKFVTGLTLLDVDGGKTLAKDYTSPGRVLLMGSAGDLYIRNELDDKPAVEYYKMLFEKDRRFPGGPEGELGGPGGRMPRGGPGRRRGEN